MKGKRWLALSIGALVLFIGGAAAITLVTGATMAEGIIIGLFCGMLGGSIAGPAFGIFLMEN